MAKDSKIIRNAANSALRFWEPMRIVYNLILIAGLFSFTFGNSWSFIFARFVNLVFCAIIANVLYSSAYVPDFILGVSDYRRSLKYVRPLLLVLGVLFSLVLELASLAFMCRAAC